MQDHLQALATGDGDDSDGVSVHTGFPNPALERRGQGQPLALDINTLLVKRPSSTYLFRVQGHHWASQGIYDGDIAVVDRALGGQPADLVISWQDSGFAICRSRDLDEPGGAVGTVTAIIHQYAR